jgi:hypothetical protein
MARVCSRPVPTAVITVRTLKNRYTFVLISSVTPACAAWSSRTLSRLFRRPPIWFPRVETRYPDDLELPPAPVTLVDDVAVRRKRSVRGGRAKKPR